MGLFEEEIKKINEHHASDESLSFCGRGFKDDDVRILVELLKEHLYLKHLDLDRNNITSESVQYLVKLTNLITLKLSNNNITDDVVESLVDMPNLKFLYLDHNALTNNAATLILCNSAYQYILNIDGNEIGPKLRQQVQSKIEANRESKSKDELRRGFFCESLGYADTNGDDDLEKTDSKFSLTN